MSLITRPLWMTTIGCLSVIGTATAQVSKETLETITAPDKVETYIGTLSFMDGAPSPETAEKVYDHLDTMRGVDAYLKGMPGAFNDAWFHYVEDIGPFGPDKGKGGKYLILPRGYEGEVPDGYFGVAPGATGSGYSCAPRLPMDSRRQ